MIERFCLEYVKDFRPGAAARRTGVVDGSAFHWARRVLARPEAVARIAELKAGMQQKLKVEIDDVVRRLALVAAADPNELVEYRRVNCRHCWGKDHKHQRTDGGLRMARYHHEQAQKKAKAAGLDLVEDMQPFDEQGGGGFDDTREPNPECPECRGDGEGRAFFNDTRDLSEAGRALYAGVKVTKDGLEVKMHDSMKATELLGRHLGIFNDKLDVNVVQKLAARMRNRAPLA